MRKRVLFTALVLAGSLIQSCQYDDKELWSAVDNVENRIEVLEESVNSANTNIATLKQLVNAQSAAVTISAVNPTENGYEIIFSDGNRAEIINGKDGVNGTNGTNGSNGINAPEISVKEVDGELYWTLDGQFLQYNGQNIKASATDAIAPKIRINENTKEWETSVDGGKTWESTGVKAEGTPGASGDSFFQRVITDNSDYVTFILHDGTEIQVSRYDENVPSFIINGADEVLGVAMGATIQLNVTEKNVVEYSILKPDGWRVNYENGILTITAPEKDNQYAEKEGVVAINAVSDNNRSIIVKINVCTYELRVLTFEDEDSQFPEYNFYNDGGDEYFITTWSDLIPEADYMDPMIYGPMPWSSSTEYSWSDENNTMLGHIFAYNWGCYGFAGGGHVISNSYSTDYDSYGSYSTERYVYGSAGHNGSDNCCVHQGYKDHFNGANETPALFFSDGEERIIDHMWINNTVYFYNALAVGTGFNPPATEETQIAVVATGYNSEGEEVGTSEFLLCNGLDVVDEWSKWDLSGLGAVASVSFNFSYSADQDNGYGYSAPAYFAYDDVAVRF